MPTVHLTGDPDADRLLSDSPLALLIGMLLDQQVPMETAFAGPEKLRTRMGGELDAAAIADADPEALAELFKESSAIHRFPGSMAARVQALCRTIIDDWHGDAAAIWTEGSPDGATVLRRLKALPGFGDQKARIFLALLGKQYGFDGAGWREAAGAYGEEGSYRSVADIVDAESLQKVRAAKKAAKAAAKTAKA
ncbi:Fe-S cluster assembly protein HesB [Protaetiibacter sp. SSC-01]|uniref:HhH-GPD-type base excision DNA repair protein n=1 Tax=Protaetiibacter sp. SSC-01 TaxID=2759943 RepID=UPI001656DA60|nr:HhH-GPD-type base excision DNA repair protein [Protaetiibacter sp. SSC-01]QNO36546.1 Fe-S cluster assembly protein HesB [Protaetiibacter sp. SSC-01]